MRIRKPLTILLLIAACCSLWADTCQVTRSGRRIQLDGFLMDWMEKERKPWTGSPVWVWDAINTPEGVAGYFHCEKERCASWMFFIDGTRLKSKPREIRVPDTAGTEGRFFRTSHSARDSDQAVTIEWVVPWDSIAVDSGGTYAIHLAGRSSCGDTLRPLLLTGSLYTMVKHSWLPPRFAERVILIVALLAVFIVMQLKVRKKTRQRGSPGR